ncbi:MAG: cobyrinate a,c-diamide synthase [Elusimicrobia bacterium]|nr:cobyrinate a,c-diamide synthase [Elusimicrobiota bacterium]
MPRLVIAGLSGDSGKTVVSLALLAALRRKGLRPSVFKKGPDYIDAAWLGRAARTPCRNLDTYMVEPGVVRRRFASHAAGSDIAVIEGNRGLFDGQDADGTHSTAALAGLLGAPVALVVCVQKMTRTTAALIRGCLSFPPRADIVGVILNKVAGRRHADIVSSAVTKACGLPVLGVIPRLGDDAALIPGRHLGLVTPAEWGLAMGCGGGRHRLAGLDARLLAVAGRHLDVEGLIAAAGKAAPLAGGVERRDPAETPSVKKRVRIAYFKDRVFTFYYPENLEALAARGAELVGVSSLDDDSLPDADALYIGGGFPETHAERLAGNRPMMDSVRAASDAGLPIYAECGGLIYLSRSIVFQGVRHPMAGVFPVDLLMHPRPAGHGYTRARVDRPNPFFATGSEIKGHEFHYSAPRLIPREARTCLRVELGTGLGDRRDGLVHGNAMACFTHIHADGARDWAARMVSQAATFAEKWRGRHAAPSGLDAAANQI